MNYSKATLTGLTAIVLWSANVGLIKHVSERFGAVGGAALIYTLSSAVLLLTTGFPKLKSFPRGYLIAAAILFVSYEICLSLSLGFSRNGQQAIEVGMVNYLWPAMTILLGIVADRQRIHWLTVTGMLVALAGIVRVLSGDHPLSLQQVMLNVSTNPLSYGMAFAGAMIWAVYCVLTQKFARGSNGITFFFMLTAVVLWGKYGISSDTLSGFTPLSILNLVLTALCMGLGYAAWNIGILQGNASLLATVSYFIPVLSSLLASLMLHSALSFSFWQGSAMVCFGSLMSWFASRKALNKTRVNPVGRQQNS